MHDLMYQIHIFASYAKETIQFFFSLGSLCGLLLFLLEERRR
tara:strand:+ start:212 stop:337 length:126 start_codon:yes stop_codon:yes gene_type:complete